MIFFSIACASAKRSRGRLADLVVGEDGGIRPGQLPGLEERRPVDVFRQFGQIVIGRRCASAEEVRRGRRVVRQIRAWRWLARASASVSRLPPARWLAWPAAIFSYSARMSAAIVWRRCLADSRLDATPTAREASVT